MHHANFDSIATFVLTLYGLAQGSVSQGRANRMIDIYANLIAVKHKHFLRPLQQLLPSDKHQSP